MNGGERRSAYFEGKVGSTMAASLAPRSNLIIDDSLYHYEGNWAFCRFDDANIWGARFGFGRGTFDLGDYGMVQSREPTDLFIHLEILGREGATLWTSLDRYKAAQVQLHPDKPDAALHDGSRQIFNISGWPNMEWHFESEDGEIAVQAQCKLSTVTLLPDCVRPGYRFSMWLAVGTIQARVRLGGHTSEVSGTIFYDHPRINMVEQAVPEFGWYLYTPMRFADGSVLAGYYAEYADGTAVEGYLFGVFIDPQGLATWFDRTEQLSLRLDGDDKPNAWTMRWFADAMELETRCTVASTPILKSWGGLHAPQTRKANPNFPLIFEAEVSWSDGRTLQGGGLAEYLPAASSQPTFLRQKV